MISQSFIAKIYCALGRAWPFTKGRSFLFRRFSNLTIPKDSILSAPLRKSSVKLSLPFGDDSARRLALFGEDDPFLYRFLFVGAKDHPDGIFLDIGAHYGEYSLRIAKEAGNKVIAIEPQPTVAKLLRESAAREGVSSLVTVIEVVAGSEEKDVAFYESPHDTSLSKVEADGEGETWRKMSPLSKIIPVDTWKKVTLVKIDVEGFEKGVFLGLLPHLKTHAPIIVFEANNIELSQRGESLSDVVSLLKDAGYREFYTIRKNLRKLCDDPSSVENIAAFSPGHLEGVTRG